MKKAVIFFAAILVSLSACGQTNSPVFDEFILKFEELQNKYRKIYDSGDFKQKEFVLKEMLALTEGVKLSDDEQSIIAEIKASVYYNLACTYSLLNQKNQAVDYFEKSVEFGYNNYYHCLQDTDLDNIREEKRFVSLMKEMYDKSNLAILKQVGSYEKSDTLGLPRFTYETPENARMKDVRSYFKLDSIAGNGDEISKILNIMYWIHDNIRHDGSNFALAEFSSIDLYHYHKATGKGINCRHLSIALNEMYLSMGLKSRYVTCLPKDESDQDCHVINCVWVDSLQKWIWLDPTFAAYVKDENGIFLSISEVRERLIDGRPLVLNEDANWNNQSKQTKENYLLNYMAKNLYWIQAPVSSQFNPESRYRNNVNTYVSLLPIGYSRSNMGNMGTITHDPEYFWQKP